MPTFDGMAEAKEKRTSWKKVRAQEHQERKQWMKRQVVYHTYGIDDDDDEDEVTDEESNRAVTTKQNPSTCFDQCYST